jgi:uncharacterized protein YqfB (UPF0267 family)
LNITDFDTFDASLTLRDLSREEKQAVVRLMELSIEETAMEYTAKHAAQQSVQLTALRRGLAVSIIINVVLLAVVAFTIGGN